MSKRLPSPALVISLIALSLVLGGTAVGATLRSDPEAKADTKLVEKLAPTLSVKHAKSADSAEPLAFAHVSSAAVLDTANSKNVTGVTLYGNSVYCLAGLPQGFTVRGGQATIDFNDAGHQAAQFGVGDDNGHCPAGTPAFVWTFDPSNGGNSAAGFFVVLYG